MRGGEGPAATDAIIQLGALEGLGIDPVLDHLPLLTSELLIGSPVGVDQVSNPLVLDTELSSFNLIRLCCRLTSSL